jgi:hypothetical protein
MSSKIKRKHQPLAGLAGQQNSHLRKGNKEMWANRISGLLNL